ncbi:MAG TPA: NADH-quinone oxidoreductase subunit C, partial [Gammaproteobacteria bacterium]|nr:NADH-quinone oxidoreductase subunit C [Gammaproteobacteria bacterium]
MQSKELTAKYAALAAAIEAKLGPDLERLPTSTGELGYRVGHERLLEVCSTLRDAPELKFEMLIDVCGVDYQAYGLDEWQTDSATASGFSRGRVAGAAASDEEQIEAVGYKPAARFAAVYHLLSISHNHRLRLKVFCPSDARPMLDSVYGVWNSADWFEREA